MATEYYTEILMRILFPLKAQYIHNIIIDTFMANHYYLIESIYILGYNIDAIIENHIYFKIINVLYV